MAGCTEGRWLLLIHQLPQKPAYLRVKVWRRLQGLGAVAIKSSVYVMPRTDPATEDLQWVAREIAKDGGEAAICAAGFIEGLQSEEAGGGGHDFFLGQVGAGKLPRDAPLAHDHHPVAHADDLGQLR